jgi:hypothetical protein
MVIDTAGATVLTNRVMDVYLIRWVSPSAVAGHAVLITDTNDVPKWETCANGGNYVEADHIGLNEAWQGLKVPTLSSGKLYIYYH